MEKIGNVQLNYTYYHGSDAYSDGDIENRLLEIVKTSENPEEALLQENSWPLLYHLSPIRHNLLSWADFPKNASCLEIGAGCGALTGLFCQKFDRVVASDLSRRRSLINAWRNKDYENLEILVGNFQDIHINEKFDVVTLIGVLEYAISYISGPNPFSSLLSRARSFLKEGGTLILAIENKYGLKYLSGAAEDHTGRYFDGITGYPDAKNVRTFSREGLESLLSGAGFTDLSFYYPYPDYKLPLAVFSDQWLPSPGDLRSYAPSYDRERLRLFDEALAADSLLRDGLYPQVSNSFLIFGSISKKSYAQSHIFEI